MATTSTVTLSSNGKYWQAFYYDSMGKRRAKSLGPKSRISNGRPKFYVTDLQRNSNLTRLVLVLAKPCVWVSI